ncbi:MAG: hypothetical protein R3D33_04970 [Hyphomicrobiaceae bacterium]
MATIFSALVDIAEALLGVRKQVPAPRDEGQRPEEWTLAQKPRNFGGPGRDTPEEPRRDSDDDRSWRIAAE